MFEMSLNEVASFFNLIDVIDFASVYFIPKIKGYFCKLDYVKNVLLQKIRYKKKQPRFSKLPLQYPGPGSNRHECYLIGF